MNAPTMDLQTFSDTVEQWVGSLEEFILDTMPQKGDKSADCQRTYLLMQLSDLQSAFGGVTEADFVPHPDW